MNEVDKRTTTILIAMVAMTITIGTAYADKSVVFPTLPSEYMTGMSVKSEVLSEKDYQVVIIVNYHVPSALQVIENIIVPRLDGTTYTIPVQKQFIETNNPIITIPGPTPEEIAKQIQANSTSRENARINELTKGLKECWYGQENFHTIQGKSPFETPEELVYSIRHYKTENQIKILNSAYEECRIMKQYQQWIPAYKDYPPVDEGSDARRRSLDTSDSPTTIDVTQAAIDAEAQRALEYSCSETGKQRGLCQYNLTGVNRGTPVVPADVMAANAAYKAANAYLSAHPNIDPLTLQIAAQNITCQIAWKSTSEGAISQLWWRVILLDGTCDPFIPELKDIPKYIQPVQTPKNCPDCKVK